MRLDSTGAGTCPPFPVPQGGLTQRLDRPGRKRMNYLDCAVIVAVVAMHVVQVSIYQVIHMIPVGHNLMATTRAMLVIRRMATASVPLCAPFRVVVRDLYHVVVVMTFVHMVHVTIVQVICMVSMLDCRVPAARPMHVVAVIVVVMVVCHLLVFLFGGTGFRHSWSAL